jgi:hypothetical protein
VSIAKFLVPAAVLGGVIYYGREKEKKEELERHREREQMRAYEEALRQTGGSDEQR